MCVYAGLTYSEVTDFEFGIVAQRLRELAYLNSGLAIYLRDDRNGKSIEYKFDGGIVEYVKTLNKNKDVLHKNVIYGSASGTT